LRAADKILGLASKIPRSFRGMGRWGIRGFDEYRAMLVTARDRVPEIEIGGEIGAGSGGGEAVGGFGCGLGQGDAGRRSFVQVVYLAL